MKFIRTSLLGLLALPLAAQSSGFNVGASLIFAPKQYFGSYDKAVHNNTGFVLDAGYDLNVYHTDVPARLTLSYINMPGKVDSYGMKTSLQSVQFAGDVFLQTPIPELRGLVGLSFNRYSMSNSSTNKFPSQGGVSGENWNPGDYNHHYPFRDCKGIKFGYRMGLEYAFSKQWSADVVLQQTELAGHSNSDPLLRKGGIDPSWLQLGFHFKF